MGGVLAGLQDLVALDRLRADLPLPLRSGRVGHAAPDRVRVDRIPPGARRVPGLQILDCDPVFRCTGLRRGAGKPAGGQEQAGVIGALAVEGVEQPFKSPSFLVLPLPLTRRQIGIVGLLAVERSTQIGDGLQGLRIGLGGGVLVEVALVLPEFVGDPRGQSGLCIEVVLLTADRAGRVLPVGQRVEAARLLQPVERLAPLPKPAVEGVELLPGRVLVPLVRHGQRGVLPVVPVGQRVQLVRRLVESVLRGRGHGRPTQAQHLRHQALVLPQLLGRRVVGPVGRAARRCGCLRAVSYTHPPRM